MLERDLRALDLTLGAVAEELVGELEAPPDAGRAERVTFREKSYVRIPKECRRGTRTPTPLRAPDFEVWNQGDALHGPAAICRNGGRLSVRRVAVVRTPFPAYWEKVGRNQYITPVHAGAIRAGGWAGQVGPILI